MALRVSTSMTTTMTNMPLYVVVLIALGIAFFRVHLRVKTTLVGYEIGRLKATEGRLLAERSELSVELARLTGRDALQARDLGPTDAPALTPTPLEAQH